MWRIFEGGGYFVRTLRASGVDCDFLVAIYGIKVFEKKPSKEEKIGALIYDVDETWILLWAREVSSVSYVRGERERESTWDLFTLLGLKSEDNLSLITKYSTDSGMVSRGSDVNGQRKDRSRR